jgi:UDP-glucose 4-epimerase
VKTSYDFLVTGGAGFIGSHLCSRLVSTGRSVLVLDDLSTGRMENIAHLEHSPLFQFTRGTVMDRDTVSDLAGRCGSVVHLAAAVGVENIIRHPVETIETNIGGTESVLSAAAAHGLKVFVASTSEVYGKSWETPFREDGDIVLGATSRSRWSYACSKALDEFLALAHHKARGLPVVVGRLFNTVGPRQSGRYGMVLPRFINQALTGKPITVFGNGTQTRCFSSVHEVIQCILALMKTPEAVGKVINIGSVQEITILELARRVLEITGSSSAIELTPYDEAYPGDFEDMQRRVPDVTLLQSLIGFSPSASIEDIIRSILEHGVPEGAD